MASTGALILPVLSHSKAPSLARAARLRASIVPVWVAAFMLVVAMLVWPLAAGMVSVNDDALYLRDGTLAEKIAYQWQQQLFRPLDILGGHLTHPVTMDARRVIPLQTAAFITALAGLGLVLRRLTPDWLLAYPIAVLWLCLHASTSVSLWQPDTISQSWSAALGVWLGICLWHGLDHARAGRAPWRHTVGLAMLCFAGLFTKEVFYGWCAGGVLVVLIVIGAAWRRKHRGVTPRCLPLLLPLMLAPMLVFALRWGAGGPEAKEGYTIGLGANLVRNAALIGTGYFASVPIHLVRLSNGPWLLRGLAIIGIPLSALVSGLPWILNHRHGRPWANAPAGRTIAMIAALSLCGTAATLPMARNVSELYLFGPNIGAAVLVSIGLVGLVRLCRSHRRNTASQRWLAAGTIAAALCIVGIGGLGLVSRANHFRITWATATQLNETIRNHVAALPDNVRATRVVLGPRYRQGHVHSQYVIPPCATLLIDKNGRWQKEVAPGRRIIVVNEANAVRQEPYDLTLDGSDLPSRPGW
ncbi:MAG: hypothetical protein JXA69_06340 [Phycisphaerae bacterium]|nr:hypothetical protein [Phycisphaerae bacterium]